MDGPTPYREGKPLAEIIPPDRRRAKLIALVVSSMIAGIGLWVLGGYALDEMRSDPPRPPTRTPGYPAGAIRAAVLHGPSGDVTMPPATRSVVHVWLQGCQDCMPAVEAFHAMKDAGRLDVADLPVVNVAYGGARTEWAAQYGLDDKLVFDPSGKALVQPLGIGTFTTVVLDPQGWIRFKDRPDNAGYADRLAGATHALLTQDPKPVP